MERKIHIQIGIVLAALVLAYKLADIQLFDPDYKFAADSNIITKVTEYPLRGMIYDREGRLVVSNRPVFDLMVIPKELSIDDTLKFCAFMGIDEGFLRQQLDKAKKYSWVKPSLFIKWMPMQDYACIQDRLAEYPGITVVPKTVREYPVNSMANVLGYVKEVDKEFLATDTSQYYRMGDLIGKSGIELQYEQQLRGQRGISYVLTNVRGVVKGKFRNGELDTMPVVGQNLTASIDLELQRYAELLMANKKGAVVAIEPATGEILAILSSPSFDLNDITGTGPLPAANYLKLLRDPNKPLFNRATMSPYPPGSTFKTLMALAGLQDGALDTVNTRFACIKGLVNCHNHPSPLNLYGSIQHSCNPFYYQAFRRVINQGKEKDYDQDTRTGLEHFRNHMLTFGLGRKLGADIPFEVSGRIPSVKYYNDNYYLKDWKISNIQSISIGQGEVGVVPLQLANVAATIANRGWYIVPHLIKGVGGDMKIDKVYTEKQYTSVEPRHFDMVARSMADVVRAGTARRAFINDIVVCGKTGTAQNPHGKDHSVFMAFAPLHNPKIAIAVYVENAGFGGTWAAPVASLIMEKHIRGEITRKWVEDYVLSGNFLETPEETAPVQ